MSSEADASGRISSVIRGVDLSVTTAAVVFWLIVLGWAYTQAVGQVQYGVIFVGAIMTVYALDQTKEALEAGDRIDAAVLLPASVVLITASLYFTLNFDAVYIQRQGYSLEHEYMLGRLVIISLLYLTWREFGNVFLGVIGTFILYGVFGNHAPGILEHAGMGELTLLQTLVTDLYGFYGSLTQLTASWIAPFMLYAGLLFAYGAFDLILRVAIVASKYIRSGVAQTAVLASAIIGSINGSYTANVAMTGSFTIPTMQESGMDGHRAAGIESVASTAGQVLPPIMGASAFVMASYLGVTYAKIVVAGLAPAAILVVSIAVAVHYTAISDTSSQDMTFSSHFDETMSRRQKVVEGVRFGIPFFVLVYLLGIAQYTVPSSAFWTIVAMIVTGITLPVLSRGTSEGAAGIAAELKAQISNTIIGFRRGAIILAPIAIILIAISGAVNVLTTTGVPNKIALLLVNLSGGVLLFAVLLGMVVAILMGMGMPTVASYVIVALLIAPTFVSEFGVPNITAQYTVFYAAILAGITPPIATAAIVASGIAGANFWRTCISAIKIATPLFVLPVAFVYNPGLISLSPGLSTLVIGFFVMMGAITIAYGLNYPFTIGTGGRIGARLILTILGVVVMVNPSLLIKVAGSVVFIAIFIGEKFVAHDLRVPVTTGGKQ